MQMSPPNPGQTPTSSLGLRQLETDFSELEAISLELARRELHEQIRYFVPHGGQLEFLRLIEEPGAFIVVSGAGNGWGKSELLAAIFAAAMWPDLAPPALGHFKEWTFPKRGRIYSKPAELEEIGSLQTAISRLFPKDRYTVHKGRYSYPSVFKSDTGWVLDLFSYERDEAEAAGPNIGLQAFNEPPPEPLFREAVARSRAGGLILGGMTSLDDNVWVVDGLLGKHNGKDIRVRYGSACENCKQHGVNGHLEHTQIERILAQFPPDERDARFSGKPLSLSGRIFKTFDRDVHVAKEEIRPPSGVKVVQVIDPAAGKPFAVIYAFADSAGNLTIFDEYPDYTFYGAKDPGLDINAYVEAFKTKEAGFKVEQRIIDRHYGNSRHVPGAKTLREEFGERSLDFEDSYHVADEKPEVQTGILKVSEYLAYNKAANIDAANKPRLIISPNCKNTIAAIEKWTRDPKTLKPKDDGYKDHCDCLRYLVMAEPKFEPASDWIPKQGPYYA